MPPHKNDRRTNAHQVSNPMKNMCKRMKGNAMAGVIDGSIFEDRRRYIITSL